MTVHLSLVLVLALVVWLLIKKGGLTVGPAIAAILFGFFLEDTSLAPAISRTVQSVADVISRLDL